MTNVLTSASLFGAPKPEKRMDLANEDVPRNTAGTLEDAMDPSGMDSSGDVREADANDSANAPFGAGLLVAAPKVATGTVQSFTDISKAPYPGRKV